MKRKTRGGGSCVERRKPMETIAVSDQRLLSRGRTFEGGVASEGKVTSRLYS